MRAIYVGQEVDVLHEMSMFLAGPSPRGKKDYNWRPEALEFLDRFGFEGDVYVPLLENGGWLQNYEVQIDWELDYLDKATVIAFWIPREMPHLPGRTTDKEWGMYIRSGKAVVGYPKLTRRGKKTPGMGYIDYVSKKYNAPVFHTLHETLGRAAGMCYR